MSLKKVLDNYNKSSITHNDLLSITEEYIHLGKNYMRKYPSAQDFINLNEELFRKNPNAKIEYENISMKQQELENKFFNYRRIMCNDPANKDLELCSETFEEFYASKQYHYGQNPYNIVKILTNDIEKLRKN